MSDGDAEALPVLRIEAEISSLGDDAVDCAKDAIGGGTCRLTRIQQFQQIWGAI
jgi:hypothetical protein